MSPRDAPHQIGDLPQIGRPATSALLTAGANNLAQVAALGRHELLATHGVGPKALRLLEEALRERGLTLSD